MASNIPQHKRLAMGQSIQNKASGGSISVRPKMLKTGIPDSPLENAKRDNGIPGMKKGGSMKGKGC